MGYDGRISSPDLERAVIEGLNAAGIDAIRIGLGPTPMLYFAVNVLDADGGVIITSSHNPPEYNGFKLMLGKKSFWGEDIRRLGDMASLGQFTTGNGGVADSPMMEAYVARVVADYQPGRDLTIAWDAGNGAAGEAMARLCPLLPGRHILLNETIDGTFPAHHPDRTEKPGTADRDGQGRTLRCGFRL